MAGDIPTPQREREKRENVGHVFSGWLVNSAKLKILLKILFCIHVVFAYTVLKELYSNLNIFEKGAKYLYSKHTAMEFKLFSCYRIFLLIRVST